VPIGIWAGPMDTPTIEDKIIVHLSQYSRYSQDYLCPPGMTQQGICERLGLTQPHISVELKKLIEDKVVEYRTARVKTSKTRKKVYFLTPRGENAAKTIKEAIPMEIFDLRTDIAIKEHLELREFDNLDFLTP